MTAHAGTADPFGGTMTVDAPAVRGVSFVIRDAHPAPPTDAEILERLAIVHAMTYGVTLEFARTQLVSDALRWHHEDPDVDRWYWAAIAAGWTDQEWPIVARVMACESKGDPSARNRSGASGLMQLLGWTGTMIRLGIWTDAADRFSGPLNLVAAKWVKDNTSWSAWQCY
jgi:hypothetical protein